MKKFKICVHQVNGVWIAREDAMKLETKGEGITPLAALMNLLRQLGEDQFILEQIQLIETDDTDENVLLFEVPMSARRKIPKPSIN